MISFLDYSTTNYRSYFQIEMNEIISILPSVGGRIRFENSFMIILYIVENLSFWSRKDGAFSVSPDKSLSYSNILY